MNKDPKLVCPVCGHSWFNHEPNKGCNVQVDNPNPGTAEGPYRRCDCQETPTIPAVDPLPIAVGDVVTAEFEVTSISRKDSDGNPWVSLRAVNNYGGVEDQPVLSLRLFALSRKEARRSNKEE